MGKKKGSTDDFESILGDINTELEPEMVEVLKPRLVRKATRTTAGNDTQTTLYYPNSWKRRLKEQALHEDTTVNKLVLEGVRLAFEKRGIKLD